MPKIGINQLVVRQIPESKFSHFEGMTLDEVIALVEKNFHLAQLSGREGVLLVPLPIQGFFSGVVQITSETVLRATFAARRREESPYLQVEAIGEKKLPAQFVEAVIYRQDILAATNDSSTNEEWELVSINARPTLEPEPPTPVAMARNLLELHGGTKAEYSAKQFAASIMYWSTRAMCG